MRRFALLSVLALLALPGGAGAAPKTVRLWSLPISNRLTDAPPKGLSKGDVVRQRTRLLNAGPQFGKPAGAAVGYDESVIRLSSPTRAVVDVVVHLPGGTLHAHGTVSIDRTASTLPVVAGTGAFAGARGTGTELDEPSGDRALNIYHLTYGTVA